MTTKPTPTLLDNPAYRDALMAGTAASSRRAYTRDIRYFWTWAQLALRQPVQYPVSIDVIVEFILAHAGTMAPDIADQLIAERLRAKRGPLRITTIRRYLTSLSVAHAEQGVDSPTLAPPVKLLLRRLQRARSDKCPQQKAAITADILRRLLETCDVSLRGVRDRAILLVGFASGGRRRTELANLQIDDLHKVEGGYLIRLRHSKTDQVGKGQEVPILGEAAQALATWLIKSGLREGKLFRGIRNNGRLHGSIAGRTINRLVKHRARLAGLDPNHFGAHSLRSGFITESGRQGAPLSDAMALSGHRTTEIAHSYHRAGELLRNPSAQLLK